MRFEPVGFCIYCGATDVKLTMEHIVPFALNGELELPDASCKECARITGAVVEQKVLKQTFPYLRFRYNLRTRRPKQRPTHFTIGCGNRSVTFPNSELPYLTWAMPQFSMPGIVDGRSPDDVGHRSVRAQAGAGDLERLMSAGGGREAVNVNLGSLDENFCRRMIAKIAHSFAYSQLTNSIEYLLYDTILSGSFTSYYIGSEQGNTTSDDTLYSLQIGTIDYDVNRYSAVRIRLF
jgi:HNH endonuclease